MRHILFLLLTFRIAAAQELIFEDGIYVEKAIPLAFGDNYRGYKILGTTHDYLTKFKAFSSDYFFTEEDATSKAL